jgi:LPS export ABC transporter protein LptC/lipopolysaccharide transport protein LptA
MKWQRRARVILAMVGVACVVTVYAALRPRPATRAEPRVARSDPSAVVEGGAGQTLRFNREHEEVRISRQKLLTYEDGTSKMVGVKVVTERAGGRIFTITGREGQVGNEQSTVTLIGDVHAIASDGLELWTEKATYTESDGTVHALGEVRFSRGRMSGSGVGFTFQKNDNVLTIADQAKVQVAADEEGGGSLQIESGTLQFLRNDHVLHFERSFKALRDRQIIQSDTAVAHVTPDEERIEFLELRGSSRITTADPMPGSLRLLAGRDIDLKYRPDGRTLEQANITDTAMLEIAGDAGAAARQIAANTIAVTVADDGATPTLLTGRDNVRLTMPGEAQGTTRTIAARALDAGDGKSGITRARFTGGVQFAERGPDLNRTAVSNILDVNTAAGFTSISDARFTQGVRFTDVDMVGTGAAGRYVLDKGILELTGSDAANRTPHVQNKQITVDAARIEVTLDGPIVNASGAVKSLIRAQQDDKTHIPSMLKRDQPVNVTANEMAYDGHASRAVYTGAAQLWQGETTIKGSAITIDDKTGDLSAAGPVTTTSVMLQEGKDGKKEQIRSIGSSKEFSYEDATRKATYTGDAHLTGTQGDTTAAKIELYLLESGDEIERAEAYDDGKNDVTLRDQNRTTKGAHLTYHAADERYVVTGRPVSILDECGRNTEGRTLTFFRTTDRIIVDGNEQVRTQSKGKSNCPQ